MHSKRTLGVSRPPVLLHGSSALGAPAYETSAIISAVLMEQQFQELAFCHSTTTDSQRSCTVVFERQRTYRVKEFYWNQQLT